ncbi:uncharacterized protein LOC124156165 isoform X2 [Ischnura elegans]|nr:uncharacterized protein LOC124156165 isoform X2 [Ischnura elegans]
MRPDVQQFFDDPTSALKKIIRIIEFQEGHRQRLTSHRRMTGAKFHAAKMEIHKLRKKIEELEMEINFLRQQTAFTSTPSEMFPRPSPPSSWNLTPRQQSQSKMSPLSPANSEGWVTPNRLTLKRTPSPSNRPLSIPPPGQGAITCQGLVKQRKPPPSGMISSNSLQKAGSQPKMHSSQHPGTNTPTRGSFRVHRSYSSQPSTPLTPIHSNLSLHCRDSQNVTPSPRISSYNIARGSTPIPSSSLLSNLKLTSPV